MSQLTKTFPGQRVLAMAATAVSGLVLSGCNTLPLGIKPEVAVHLHKQIEWYAMVDSTVSRVEKPDLFDKQIKTHCGELAMKVVSEAHKQFCANPDAYRIIAVAPHWNISSYFFWIWGFAPAATSLQTGDFVHFGAVRQREDLIVGLVPMTKVADKNSPVAGCGWVGPNPRLSGSLMVAAGTVCNGWDFRETFVWKEASTSTFTGGYGRTSTYGPPAPYVAPVDGPQQTGFAARKAREAAQSRPVQGRVGMTDPR